VSLEQVTENINPRTYNQKFIPVAVLLSGEFTSIFQNRPLRRYNNGKTFDFIPQSTIPTQQVVVADGDIIRNDVLANGNTFPLGYDRFTKQILYGNKDFVRNIISYLTEDSGVMELRNRVVTLRLLDRVRVVRQRTMWIVINTVAPLALLAVGGLTFIYLRKRKYGRKLNE
jgi:gliding-associated putative ABC transporter substrate-binding component GldG